MKKAIISLILGSTISYTTICLADDIQLTGTQPQAVAVTPSQRFSLRAQPQSIKQIPLLSFKLSHTGKTYLEERQTSVEFTPPRDNNTVFHSRQLDMNNVPVLDQGAHGTCATFATTAAVEAATNKANEISQLCQLQLGNYLAETGYHPSGWDGTFGYVALNQIETFGFVTKALQASHGCGGLTQYPSLDDTTPTGQITPDAFHQMSKPLPFLWYPILHVSEAFSKPIYPAKILLKVKASINENDRVVFGTLLVDVDTGTVGALGKHHVKQDTWVITPQIRHDIDTGSEFSGHEMVITGYDDDAIAVDETGKQHRGLLTLRNSWGPLVGDQGNFYMSYEYFMNLVVEAYSIHGLRPKDAFAVAA